MEVQVDLSVENAKIFAQFSIGEVNITISYPVDFDEAEWQSILYLSGNLMELMYKASQNV